MNGQKYIILFDGKCNFCSRWVQFIIRHDKKRKFMFASLESEVGKKLSEQSGVPKQEDTAVLIENEKIYVKSSMALRIMKHLGGIFYPLCFFVIIPKFMRDRVYDFVARNRYTWRGKREECKVS